jgi:hypothetical protein
MFTILFFLIIGIAVGQFVKVEINPKALRLLQDGLALTRDKLPALAVQGRKAVTAIKGKAKGMEIPTVPATKL